MRVAESAETPPTACGVGFHEFCEGPERLVGVATLTGCGAERDGLGAETVALEGVVLEAVALEAVAPEAGAL